MVLLNFGRTVLSVANLGRSGRMTRHIFNCVCVFDAFFVALTWVPFTLRFVRLLAVFVTHGMITAAMTMIFLALIFFTLLIALSSTHLTEHLCTEPWAPVDALLTKSTSKC